MVRFAKTRYRMGKSRNKRKQKQAKRKHGDSRSTAAGPSQQIEWLREALKEGRGRRAVTVADRLIAGAGLEQPEATDLIAAAGELRIRELCRDGHDTQAAARAVRLGAATTEPSN